MDERLLKKLAEQANVAPRPGDSSPVKSPTVGKPIEVAVIHHHRFAFYYWLKWSTQNWTKSLPTNELAPDLVTMDFHDDVGGKCDCVFDELDLLIGQLEVRDVNDKQELMDASRRRVLAQRNTSTYSLLGLRALNDGHIFPAQHLNALGDVFVLYKQRGPSERSCRDRYGNEHRIRYFNDTVELVHALNEQPYRKTYFDLDVDYFFEADAEGIHGNEQMIPENEIRQILATDSGVMQRILNRNLQGVTFALGERPLNRILHGLVFSRVLFPRIQEFNHGKFKAHVSCGVLAKCLAAVY